MHFRPAKRLSPGLVRASRVRTHAFSRSVPAVIDWFQRLRRPRYRVVGSLHDLGKGLVDVTGVAQAIDGMRDPIRTEPCIAINYRAWPPSTTVGMDGATAHSSRGFQVDARQATDFLMVEQHARVLVRPDPGQDVASVHHELVVRYGVDLRTDVDVLHQGMRVRVLGKVIRDMTDGGAPHRNAPYQAVIAAHRFWPIR